MLAPTHLLVALAAALILSPTPSSADPIYCGNKYCGIGAVCGGSRDSRSCECPLSQPLGDPAFQCHGDETVSCVLIGDPSLLGFTGDLTFLDFPCKYTFTRFDTPLLTRASNTEPANDWTTADPGPDRCRIIIHGTNAHTPKGSYYLQSVDVSISFNIGGSHTLQTLLIKLEAGRATYSYAPDPETIVNREDEHGCYTRELNAIDGIGVTLCYTNETRTWSAGVPVCGATFINFRAWDSTTENQVFRPGVAITTNGKNALFSNKENGYPNTMCDSPFNDADDVYHDSCKKTGIVGKRNCALFAFLNNNPPQQPHYCVPSIQLLSVCPGDKKADAINKCGSIITQLGRCVLKNQRDIMHIFEACVSAVCFNPATCSSIADFVHRGDDAECNSFENPC